ncbi:MAG: ComF family protein [Lachnospiraceae bacterium]|nr:ComF family protein [Lachnospiraceae bacterium]
MLDLLFPVCCPVCLEPVLPKGRDLHTACKKKLRFISEPYCMKCGRPVPDPSKELCGGCGGAHTWFDAGRCVFPYRSCISDALVDVKKNGTREFVDFFGRAAVKRLGDFIESVSPDILVPVPLHKKKLKARGFNQSGLIAHAISLYSGIPAEDILKKERETADQKTLSKHERERNLSRAFAVREGAPVPGTVLVVDDIFTTGSTVNACAHILKDAGAEKVYFLCIAAGSAVE